MSTQMLRLEITVESLLSPHQQYEHCLRKLHLLTNKQNTFVTLNEMNKITTHEQQTQRRTYEYHDFIDAYTASNTPFRSVR
jgi:hypothetical protein